MHQTSRRTCHPIEVAWRFSFSGVLFVIQCNSTYDDTPPSRHGRHMRIPATASFALDSQSIMYLQKAPQVTQVCGNVHDWTYVFGCGPQLRTTVMCGRRLNNCLESMITCVWHSSLVSILCCFEGLAQWKRQTMVLNVKGPHCCGVQDWHCLVPSTLQSLAR